MSDHARFRNRFAVLILPVLFLVEFDLHGQAAPPAAPAAVPPSRVSQLADEKITISKLDWILLIARVRALEQVIAHESSRPVSLVGMRYDREKRPVVTKAFVDPAWISSAKIDDVHKLLTEQGANYCTDG